MAGADDEVWYPVPSLPGYHLSSEMRFRATATPGGPPRSGIKKFTPNKSGYLVAGIWKGGKKGTVYLHHMIAELAYGERPTGLQVLYRDDDKANNYPSNLAYGDQKTNVQDMLRNGHARVGGDCPWAKLRDADVRQIRGRIASGESQASIAKSFGVHQCVISHIKSGKRWSRVI